MAKDKAATPHAALAKHAGRKDTIEFGEEVRHGRLRFFKGTVVRFEDPAAAAFFDVAFNCTEFTDAEPVVTIGSDELNFDPEAPGETIDPHTIIGRGREGIEPGTTVVGHLNGEGATTDGTLQAHDSTAGAEG
jgi:hypothetical protein